MITRMGLRHSKSSSNLDFPNLKLGGVKVEDGTELGTALMIASETQVELEKYKKALRKLAKKMAHSPCAYCDLDNGQCVKESENCIETIILWALDEAE